MTDPTRALHDLTDLIARLDVPQLRRGRVWCTTCGTTRTVDSGKALANGWPKCCGYTMTIDSPEERAALRARAPS
jgi:hypothetical protein